MEDETKGKKSSGTRVSFLKKGSPLDPERVAEAQKSQPVFDSKLKVVFVNGSKYRRAEDILGLIIGTKPVVKTEDVERKDHYARQLAAHEIDVNSDEALPALYEILGGLIRTPAEQKQAEAQAKEMKAKAKKRAIE